MLNVGRSRPLGITIIAILLFVVGILGLLGSILGLAASIGHPVVIGLLIFGLVLSVLELVLAWGLWTLRSWAFWATVIIEALSVIQGIIALTQGASLLSVLISLIIPIIILVYMFVDRNVRAAFRT